MAVEHQPEDDDHDSIRPDGILKSLTRAIAADLAMLPRQADRRAIHQRKRSWWGVRIVEHWVHDLYIVRTPLPRPLPQGCSLAWDMTQSKCRVRA